VAGELTPGNVRLLVQNAHDLKAVRDSLRWLPLPRALVADVVLAASELVTNALQYADGWCEFSALYPTVSGAVRVEVSDNGPLPPPLPGGSVDASAIAGRGLRIVEAVVTRWGIEQTSPDSKTIWFEMDTAAT
jgi:anti-sigma regulatory factor (Ser/Thr protein kinase)